MFGFEGALNDFLTALFAFLNELLNGIFGFLADLFGGITVNFS
jgi:nitrate/nitrite transporter NarK